MKDKYEHTVELFLDNFSRTFSFNEELIKKINLDSFTYEELNGLLNYTIKKYKDPDSDKWDKIEVLQYEIIFLLEKMEGKIII